MSFWKANLRRRQPFFVFFGSYLVLLLLPLIAGGAVYRSVVNLTREESRQRIVDALEQSAAGLDNYLSELESYATRLVLDADIRELFYSSEPLPGPAVYRVYAAWRQLVRIQAPGSAVAEVLLYSAQYRTIVSRYASYLETDRFYPRHFRHEELSYAEWAQMLFVPRASGSFRASESARLDGRPLRILTYARSVPLGDEEVYRGSVILLVDEPALALHFVPILERGASAITVCDAHGLPMLSIAPPAHEALVGSSEGMSRFFTTISRNEWTVEAVLPSRIVFENVAVIRSTTIAIATLVLLAGAAVAFSLAYRNSAPLLRIIEEVREKLGVSSSGGAYGYEFLSSAVSQLLRSKSSLEKSVQAQLPQVRAVFFERLLHGELADNEEIMRIAGHIRFPLSSSCHVVLLVRINGYHDLLNEEVLERLSSVRTVLRRAVQRGFSAAVYCHDVNESTVAVLISGANVTQCVDKSEELYGGILRLAVKDLRISVTVSAGEVKDAPSRICVSFEEAQYSLQHGSSADATGRGIAWFDRAGGRAGFYYPLELERQLESAVRAANMPKVNDILARIYQMNFGDRTLSQSTAIDLLHDLKGTVIKLTESLVDDGDGRREPILARVGHLHELDDPSESFESLRSAYRDICSFVAGQMKSHNTRLAMGIVTYLDDHYTDTDLCLSKVAPCFGLSEMYLSQFFKEQTGENFHAYVESMRMREAESLLQEPRLSVKDISKSVGYSNTNTFLKAFKRWHGVSPSMHRRQTQAE